MKHIQITLKVDDQEIFRNYEVDEDMYEKNAENWGENLLDMYDTIEKSHEKRF